MEELGRRVERWVEAGVIGREQGDAILRRAVLLGLGVAAMVVFLGQVAAEYWQDLGAPLAILLVGLGLVASAALLARLRPAGTRAHPAGTRDR